MKKLTLALMGAGLLVSLNSFAISPDCSNSGFSTGICAPKFCGGFYAGVTGLYFRTTASGDALNGQIFNFSNSTGRDSFESRLHRFDPDHEWNWEAKIGYELPCTANNVELSYTHINNDDRLSDNLSESPASVGSYFFSGVGTPTSGSLALTDFDSHSRLRYDFDKFDLTVGRTYSDVCGNFTIRPAIGVRYAKVDHKYTNNVDSVVSFEGAEGLAPAASSPLLIHANVKSEFKGTGPMLGVDARWGVLNGIGLIGHFDTSLLVGRTDSSSAFNLDFTDATFATVLENLPSFDFFPKAGEKFHAPDADRVVTSVTGKIGLDYHFCFCNKSSLAVEVGYQASKFYDAIDLIRGNLANPLATIVPGLPAPAATNNITSTDSHDFEFRGPYVNVTFHV